jgi:hypothetical protein
VAEGSARVGGGVPGEVGGRGGHMASGRLRARVL